MTKIESITTDLIHANQKLDEALNAQPTELNQDASIQRFEFTFELAWKLMQEILISNFKKPRGVKDVIRLATDMGIIDNNNWFNFLECRNITVHTYKMEVAREIYSKIKDFPNEVNKLLKNSKGF